MRSRAPALKGAAMEQLTAEHIFVVIHNTLNRIDPRIVDHGRRVANLVYRAMRQQNKYSHDELRACYAMALIHDIGAYKTEEIDRMLQFETVDVWNHAIYGYLFLSNFTPLQNLAPVLFFHHASCEELQYLHPSYHDLAQILHFADRLDIFIQQGASDHATLQSEFIPHIGREFPPHIAALFGSLPPMPQEEEDAIFHTLLSGTPLAHDVARGYLWMIVFSIDFRSRQTVTHTVTTAAISRALAELLRLPGEEQEDIYLAAMLHDIGKQGIPLEILESPRRLTGEEMAIMKGHVVFTEEILLGNIDESVLRIAIRHHEKLDGSGYPYELHAGELSISDRIVCVADIFSALYGSRSYKEAYSRQQVLQILRGMGDEGKIDPSLVALCEAHYERITFQIEQAALPVLLAYRRIRQGHEAYTSLMKDLIARSLPPAGLVLPDQYIPSSCGIARPIPPLLREQDAEYCMMG